MRDILKYMRDSRTTSTEYSPVFTSTDDCGCCKQPMFSSVNKCVRIDVAGNREESDICTQCGHEIHLKNLSIKYYPNGVS